MCWLQKLDSRLWLFLTTIVLLEKSKKVYYADIRSSCFPLFFKHEFIAGCGSVTVWNSIRTIVKPNSSKFVDGKGETIFLTFWCQYLTLLIQFPANIWSTNYSMSNNKKLLTLEQRSVLRTWVLLKIELKKIIWNIENWILYIVRQNKNYFENVLDK